MTFINREGVLSVFFDSKIDYSLVYSYSELNKYCSLNVFQVMNLNFHNTKFITLPGSMYILLMISEMVTKNDMRGRPIEVRISECSDAVMNSLLNFGLIDNLKIYANLKIPKELNSTNDYKMKFWRKEAAGLDYLLGSLYWPISIIPIKTEDSFERDIRSFINNFILYFNLLVKSGLIEISSLTEMEFTRKDFISAINEATKNVWDHSESWGAASIYSGTNKKTTFCLFDHGIGFIDSYVKRKGAFERNTDNNKKVLAWLFKEGNTSDEANNHGKGLAKIAKFVEHVQGIMLIRTDRYIIHYDWKKSLRIDENIAFPGTQIMINF